MSRPHERAPPHTPHTHRPQADEMQDLHRRRQVPFFLGDLSCLLPLHFLPLEKELYAMQEFDYLRAKAPVPVRELLPLVMAGTREPRPTQFTLDVRRFSAGDPRLFDTRGRVIGRAETLDPGTLAERVYPTQRGLFREGRAYLRFPVRLAEQFTVICRFEDFTIGQGRVHGFMNFSDRSLESVIDDGASGYHWWFLTRQAGGHDRAVFNGTGGQGVDVSYRYHDHTIPPADYPLYSMEHRLVCDGTTISMYLNGILRAQESAEPFGTPDYLDIGYASGEFAAHDTMTVREVTVLGTAQPPDGYRIYRMRITALRGQDGYVQLSRLCLYDAQDNRLDTDAGAVAYALCGSEPAVYPSSAETARALTGDRTGKCCLTRSRLPVQLYFSIPASCGALASYSLVTGGDSPERDPVSWEIQTSYDGGATWVTLDARTDADIPAGRDTESARFVIGA